MYRVPHKNWRTSFRRRECCSRIPPDRAVQLKPAIGYPLLQLAEYLRVVLFHQQVW